MSDAAVPAKRKNFILRFLAIREIGALIPLVVIFVLSTISNRAFATLPNLLDMLRATSYIFIVGVGMTFILCGRGLDLCLTPGRACALAEAGGRLIGHTSDAEDVAEGEELAGHARGALQLGGCLRGWWR